MEPGTRLDQYELVEKIGEGGMGVVWRARDVTLDRDVAVKVLPSSFTADANRLARFEREAKVVAALSHPNVVSIFGYGTANGVTYAAMELVQGRSLKDLLDDGPLPLRKAVELGRQIAHGLDAAHVRGIVHRDLKPDNVFITPDNCARILDFGLAGTEGQEDGTSGSESGTRTRLTDPGTVVGTAGYMSPEQARGGDTGPATDIFALGVMLHEMLAGEHPFARETTAETLTAILREEPPEPSVSGRPASPALPRVIRRCLEKAPEERFQSARDLAFALDSAAADSGTSQPAMAPVDPASGPRGSRWPAAVALAIATGLAFAGGWLSRPSAPAFEPIRVTELTFGGADFQPDVSSDGRLIAFTSGRAGKSQIWLRQVDSGSEQALTEGPDLKPRFSPDNQSVAFIRSDGELYSAYRVPVVGGRPRKLLENVTEVDWSPDMTRMAFLRGSAVDEGGSVAGVADLGTGEERVLITLGAFELLGLDWSPDGTRIALTKASTQGGAGNWRIVVVAADGSSVEEISLGNRSLLSAPEWATNNTLILAKSNSTVSGSPDPNLVVLYDLDTGSETILTYEPYLFPLRGSMSETARFRLLGNDRLIFNTFRQVQTLHVLDTESGTVRPLGSGVSTDRQPAFSPDGTRVLFTSNRSGNVDLFTYDVNGREVIQLTDHPGSDWDPAFSPDGESIIWSSDRIGHLEIWMADADGANPRQISNDGFNAENPTMTPDGSWIVYASGNENGDGVYRVRPDGTDVELLVPGPWTNPEISHSGRHVLYVHNNGNALENTVGVLDLDSGEVVDFTIAIPYQAASPNVTYGRGRWMPDDEAIAFIGVDDAGQPTVLIQDFVPGQDTRATRRQLEGSAAVGVVESLGVSPDGRFFALAQLRSIRVLKQAEGFPPLR